MFLYWQLNTCHWLLCKGQANHSIILKIATTWKLVEFVTTRSHRNNIATEMWQISKFSNGCNFKYKAVICLFFAQKSVTNVRLPVEKDFFFSRAIHSEFTWSNTDKPLGTSFNSYPTDLKPFHSSLSLTVKLLFPAPYPWPLCRSSEPSYVIFSLWCPIFNFESIMVKTGPQTWTGLI